MANHSPTRVRCGTDVTAPPALDVESLGGADWASPRTAMAHQGRRREGVTSADVVFDSVSG